MITWPVEEKSFRDAGRDSGPGPKQITPFLVLIAIYVFMLAAYTGLRYSWRSIDGDAVSLTRLSNNVLEYGTIAPGGGGYPYGYAYPVLNTTLAHLAGVSVEDLQVFVQPFLVALLVLASYVAYRSLTSSGRVALLATLLLFLSPEFLFEATRSSHAKITWLMALTMLFILAHSLQSGGSPRWLATWIIIFYVTAFALISSNAFFASSYIFGFGFAFAAPYILMSLLRTGTMIAAKMRRLMYVTAATIVLVFIFIFYIYRPAWAALWTLQHEVDRLSMLLLNMEPLNAAPYAYTQTAWLSLQVYLALTSFNWLVLLLSFIVWLRKGWSLWMRRESIEPQQLLLWLFYGSFGLVMVTSVAVDLLGALSANLQIRLFPHFLLVGIPLASQGIVDILGWIRRSRHVFAARVAPLLFTILIAFFSLASLLKITNEPLLSHYWTFHAKDERASAQWMGRHLHNSQVWIGGDIRLLTLAEAYGEWKKQAIRVERVAVPRTSRYVLTSDISRMRAARIGSALPDVRGFQKVYDTGGTQLYFSRPQTPYQR